MINDILDNPETVPITTGTRAISSLNSNAGLGNVCFANIITCTILVKKQMYLILEIYSFDLHSQEDHYLQFDFRIVIIGKVNLTYLPFKSGAVVTDSIGDNMIICCYPLVVLFHLISKLLH